MKKFVAAMFACTLAFTTCFAVVGCGGSEETPATGESGTDAADAADADTEGEEGAAAEAEGSDEGNP